MLLCLSLLVLRQLALLRQEFLIALGVTVLLVLPRYQFDAADAPKESGQSLRTVGFALDPDVLAFLQITLS